jgi:uncharacterized protein (TIGR04255 family)
MTHGKLAKDDHLVEVLFELRYSSDRSTDALVEKFHDSLKQDYPEHEKMTTQFVRFQMQPEDGAWKTVTSNDSENETLDIVRYRFKNVDGTRLCQLGNGILSINFLKYEGFDIFAQEVLRLVELHDSVFHPQTYRRLALRYMNHFPYSQDRSPISLLSWLVKLPEDEEHQVVSNVQQVLLNKGNVGFQSVVVAYPQMNQAQQSIILLDIENFLHFQQPVEANSEALAGWIQEAHEQVWNAFTTALTPDFLEEIRYGKHTKQN